MSVCVHQATEPFTWAFTSLWAVRAESGTDTEDTDITANEGTGLIERTDKSPPRTVSISWFRWCHTERRRDRDEELVVSADTPSQRVQFILGTEDDDEEHVPHDLFTELDELAFRDGDVQEWKETAR